MNTPTLIFTYAHPLDNNQRQTYLAEDKEYPKREEIREIMTHWRELWQQVNESKHIMAALVDMTKRSPIHIECFVYGAGLNAMSTPFLMPTRNRKGNVLTDEYFIQTVIHEMLHIFLITQNESYWSFIQTKYRTEDMMCQNHITVYAMLYEVYKVCMKCEPPDFSRDNLPPGYMRAIEIVKREGSAALVMEYQTLAQ